MKLGLHRSTGAPLFGALTILLVAASLSGCGSQIAGSSAPGETDVRKLEPPPDGAPAPETATKQDKG
ncbi:hypothetical protein, partial [Nocardia sp. NPDC004722]